MKNNSDQKTTYIVTGASGHLGNVLVRKLLKRGEQVTGLLLPGEKPPACGMRTVYGNVCEKESLRPLFLSGTEAVVIHCAGCVSISSYDGLQGTPYIYQGEELGMTNAGMEDIADYRDIESLNMHKERLEAGYSEKDIMTSLKAKSRDNARTPMQWDDSENAGFTTGTPWLKVNPNYKQINAASQVNDPDSVFSFYRRLVALRKEYDVFVDGAFELLYEDDPDIFAYTRTTPEETLTVLCNFHDGEAALSEKSGEKIRESGLGELLISNYKDVDETKLRPYEARMYLKKTV